MEELKAPPLGSMLGERYRLLRFLGSGATGAVYEAATPSDERVAVKVLLEIDNALAKELETRFIREASVVSSIDSEHVVHVIDSGMDRTFGVPYLVMPLLSGFDLEALLERTGPLHPTVAVRICAQACAGLMEAHRGGVVHRDIKPGNIFLDHDPSGVVTVRVLDFGMAKASETSKDKSITQAGAILGTPHYMSPEQSLNAKDVDSRTDVWGLGATLYDMLTACSPFEEAQSFIDLHIAINSETPMSVQDRCPWIDPGLARLVHGVLLRDRDLRCPSMSELRLALLPYMDGATDLNTMMLVPVPAFIRDYRAPRADLTDHWHAGAPSGKLPPISEEPIDKWLGRRVGDYKIVRRLGRGRTAGLYEAIDDDANRFAVRVIASMDGATMDKSGTRRFVREARALATIEHDHVVGLVDAAFDDALGQPYAVLDLLYGQDISNIVAKHGPIHPDIAVQLIMQACRGLQASHDRGIIHRDVRPRNVFLAELPSGEVTAKLVGFGLVKHVDLVGGQNKSYGVTVGGEMIGSPMYMSIEQAQNPTKVDFRSDVYSIGATLFYALAGSPMWPADLGVTDLVIEVVTGRPAHLQDKAPWVKKELCEIVHKALKRDPDERYASVNDLLAALASHAPRGRVMLQELAPLRSELRGMVEHRADPIVPEPAAPVDDDISIATLDPSTDMSKAIPLERLATKKSRPLAFIAAAMALLVLVAVAAVVGWVAARG
jgi:serine/threonine protein kinase